MKELDELEKEVIRELIQKAVDCESPYGNRWETFISLMDRIYNKLNLNKYGKELQYKKYSEFRSKF
jgi:hypothetical protein